ncbi:MAG: hypothetical protein EPO42_07310 [Gallionellaceae bacterium]|nr:MAG: hypothetical protein EPO42_07310 [Gallionellaceae bacterium]
MKPVNSVNFNFLPHLMAVLFSISLAGCLEGTYSSTVPGAQKRQDLTVTERAFTVPVTDPKYAYVFSSNILRRDFSCYLDDPPPGCSEQYEVGGGAINSYTIDPISGMPMLTGVEMDNPPPKTQNIAVSKSDRFMYVLTGDNLLYTYSIGWSIFTEAEFSNQNLKPVDLYNALAKAGHVAGTALSVADMVSQLNTVLEQPILFATIAANSINLVETAEIKKLKTDTRISRTKLYSDLTEVEQKAVVRLNRLMIALAYPSLTPSNKGIRALHEVGAPVAVLQPVDAGAYDVTYIATIGALELDPLGSFVYVLDRELLKGYASNGNPITAKVFSVYFKDVVTGKLTLSGHQEIGIDQLVFASSGLVAYGSTNGSLHTYSVNRTTGFLTETGAPISFIHWETGPDFNAPPYPGLLMNTWHTAPYRNMVPDPTGKFLYLIGSSGTQTGGTGCPGNAQIGSLIYTYIINPVTGALTLAGPPLNTSPHIITAGVADPKGRFLHLLNTHEFVGSSYVVDCSGGSASRTNVGATATNSGGMFTTGPYANVGAIYSTYVDPATGKLNPSGSMQFGGVQIPGGFTLAGLDSVSLSSDVSGRFIYLLNAQDMYVYNVDQANGALTVIGSPLTGATKTATPGAYSPIVWPGVCGASGNSGGSCTLVGSRAHSLTWAGY